MHFRLRIFAKGHVFSSCNDHEALGMLKTTSVFNSLMMHNAAASPPVGNWNCNPGCQPCAMSSQTSVASLQDTPVVILHCPALTACITELLRKQILPHIDTVCSSFCLTDIVIMLTFQTPYAAEEARKTPTVGEKVLYTTSCANWSQLSGRKPCRCYNHDGT